MINYDILESFNYSYVLGLINSKINNALIIDLWHFKKIDLLQSFKNISEKNLVVIDDELFEYLFSDIFQSTLLCILNEKILNTNHVLIVKTKKMYNFFRGMGFNCLYEPYFDVYEIAISFKKLKIFPKLNNENSVNFNFLNRNYNEIRDFFIRTLYETNLLEKGYVTANFNYNFNKDIQQKLKNEEFVKNNYSVEISYNTYLGGDRCNYEYEGKQVCFLNRNILEISNTIPGILMIQVESCSPISPKLSIRCPSEKTFMPFLTKRIPIIIGHSEKIKNLREEGFDVFEDIVDHSYDYLNCEINYKDKIKLLLSCNKKLLEDGLTLDQTITDRLEFNQQFLLNTWIDKKLNKLINNLEDLFKNTINVSDLQNTVTDFKYE